MPIGRRGPGNAAPYGQACMHCFKAKCKCVNRPNGDSCERCHRLNKQCYPSDSIRKRNAQNNQSSAVRISHLERKLEGVISLLQNVASSPKSSAALRHALGEEAFADHVQEQQRVVATVLPAVTPASSSSAVTENTLATDGYGAPVLSVTASSPPASPSWLPDGDSSSSVLHYHEPSAEETDACFCLFRSQMLRYLPFIHLPPDLTALQLSQDRPFLLRAIVAVTSPLAQQKLALGRQLKLTLAKAALIENESSLDLLLGLLTYVTWGNDQVFSRSATLSRLMQMAMSLVYDLHLNKPLPRDVHTIPSLHSGQHCNPDGDEVAGRRYLETERAVLACFILSSAVSSYFAQMDAMRWTPRMEEYLRMISANKQCPTDETFAVQVRLQLLAQRAVKFREQLELDQAETAQTGMASVPASLYLQPLQTQLQDLRMSLSPTLPHQDIVMAHIHYIELSICETAHTSNSVTALSWTAESGNSTKENGLSRLKCFWRSVCAIKALLDIFFTMSASEI